MREEDYPLSEVLQLKAGKLFWLLALLKLLAGTYSENLKSLVINEHAKIYPPKSFYTNSVDEGLL